MHLTDADLARLTIAERNALLDAWRAENPREYALAVGDFDLTVNERGYWELVA